MPEKKDLPSTIKKSSKKAQDTFAETLKSAEKQYGTGERASRTAYASLKHSFEKVGDHWEVKDEKGPSDPLSEGGKNTNRESFGGVDVNGHTKSELLAKGRKIDADVKTSMTKIEVARTIDKKNKQISRKK